MMRWFSTFNNDDRANDNDNDMISNSNQVGPTVESLEDRLSQQNPSLSNSNAPPAAHIESRSATSQAPSDKTGAGIVMRTLHPGDATRFPKKNDTCRIHYEGYVMTDPTAVSDERTKIDSSVDRNEPFLFRLHQNQVIKGLDLAVEKMSLGQKVEVIIPALYGYGEQGYLPMVPPRATLIFKIELIDFTNV